MVNKKMLAETLGSPASPLGPGSNGHAPARTVILHHALDALCRDGFKASIAQIAREAKVSAALVHYHFGSRNGLWAALTDQITVDIRARMETVMFAGAGLKPEDMFRLMMRTIGDYFVKHPAVAIALYETMREGGEILDHLIEAFWRSASDFLGAIITQAAGLKGKPAFTVDQALITMLGAIQHAVAGRTLYSRVSSIDTVSPEFLRAQIELVIDGMMRQLGSPSDD